MDLLLVLVLIGAFIAVPGLLNYFASRWVSVGGPQPDRWELLLAGFTLSFALLTLAAMITLLISLAYDDLRDQIADFVRMGLRDYGEDRPIALSGVFTGVAVATMALMTALGWLRVPARYLR